MKKILWLLRIVLTFLVINTIFAHEGNIYILGYPRSGNYWIRFCIKDLLGFNDPTTAPANYKIYQGHIPHHLRLNTVDQEKNYLILIIRNYRECMMRHHKNKDDRILSFMQSENAFLQQNDQQLKDTPPNYIENLKCYDEWNPKTRFLVYYEDLMEIPEQVLKELMSFLSQDARLVDLFMQKFQEKQELSYALYQTAQSKGKSVLYHTSLMQEQHILKCDAFMQSCYPEYWEKYLKRFAYQN